MDQHGYDVAIYLMPIVMSLILTIGLGLLAYSRRRVTGGRYFSVFLLLEAAWTFGYIFELLSPTLEGKIFWDNFQYIGALLIPVIILAFTFEYCDRKIRQSWPVQFGFLLPMLIGILLVYTNNWHHMALLNPHMVQGYPFDEYAYSFGIPVDLVYLYGYGLMIWSTYLLFILFLNQRGMYRLQTGIILIGTLMPILGSLLAFINLPFLPERDMSPYYFAIADLFIAFGLFKLKVFDIIPVGRSLVVENMRDGVFITDASGHLVDINQSGRNLIGQPYLTAMGQPMSSLPEKWKIHLQLNLDDDTTQLREFKLSDELGDRYFELIATRIINLHGRFSGQMLMLRDISKRKKAELALQAAYIEMENRVEDRTIELLHTIAQLKEEIHERQAAEVALQNSETRFQSIIEQSSEGFVLVDNEAHIIDTNPAIEKITGISQSEIKGQYVWDFQTKISGRKEVPPEITERIQKIFVDAMRNKEAALFKSPIEVKIITGAGEIKTIQQVSFPVIMGSTTNLGTFVRDITTQKQAEADLQKLNNELEKRVAERTQQLEMINKELESFSYSVSHDLRAPLRSINGFANALIEDAADVLSEENNKYLNRILANIKRMDELINALLNLSRLGRKPLECQLVNTRQIICSAWDEVRGEAKERNIQIAIHDFPDCTADAILLKQVFVNLLSNAVKYTRLKPEASIQVGWQQQNDRILFWVKDNGVGFDMQYAGNLFGIFQRLHREEQFEGTGVGLTTVQRIIHRHGGQIWVEAYPDQGATFYFTLGK